MVCTWFSRWALRALRRTARNQTRSTVSASSSCDSQGALSISDAEESHEAQLPSLGLLLSEIILLISELLPAADTVYLALTCKRIYYISNIRYLARCLDSDATESLLYRLERETIGVCYCIIDQKLVRFTAYKRIGHDIHYHRAMETREPPPVNFQ